MPAARDKVSIICKDCGEVSHVSLVGLKPGGMASCGSCGLVVDLTHVRPPPAPRGPVGKTGGFPAKARR